MSVAEQWRPIVGYIGYEVSDLGRIRSCQLRGGAHGRKGQLGSEWRIVGGWLSHYGYPQVGLSSESKGVITRSVHSLVTEAFHGPRPDGMVIRHLNGIRVDNRAENLRWGTPSENQLDRVRHGTHHNANKTHCKRGHPYDADNTYILPKNGARVCRTCVRASHQRRMMESANARRDQAA